MTADANAPDLRDSARLALADDLQSFVDRHETIFGRVGNIDEQLWTDRSHDVIFDNGKRTATEFGRLIYSLLAGRTAPLVEERFRPDLLDPWIDKVSRNVAAAMVAAMVSSLSDDIEPATVFASFRESAALMATSLTTSFANFGAHDGARAAGAGSKTWHTTSSNPRSSHAALDGETVPLGQMFSNGLRWPGDRDGGSDETAGCLCTISFARGR